MAARVTGANRGIGPALVRTLLNAGAKRVYVCALDVKKLEAVLALDPSRVSALPLDVTDPALVSATTAAASDVNLLINNAAILEFGVFPGAVDTDMLAGVESFRRRQQAKKAATK